MGSLETTDQQWRMAFLGMSRKLASGLPSSPAFSEEIAFSHGTQRVIGRLRAFSTMQDMGQAILFIFGRKRGIWICLTEGQGDEGGPQYHHHVTRSIGTSVTLQSALLCRSPRHATISPGLIKGTGTRRNVGFGCPFEVPKFDSRKQGSRCTN
ncbi:hypothetical protein P152DRAFT_218985 [Eremomyces bilateralis CBS 781.70]|uniref:Uncharacterized protein n=1 Tax=Eremomyces bilateralis CBS 781.70 TaxID=1392243 RepID=A0A6G1FS58_9PEZI|nr:uncharacterized protein P152DRAFT_218985 [Eremomyces bilateralis CBS 781.70]KAF1808502.1 hypothetical protein P152DRAFT_218985 [Eremomyces bilateralis CBS 781.70]